MESATQKLKNSILYLAFLYAILYLLHTFVLHKLLIGNQPLRVKKNPDRPLRFRSDGTFKILQVGFSVLCLLELSWLVLINNDLDSSQNVWLRWLTCIMGTELWLGAETFWSLSLSIALILTRPISWRQCWKLKSLISLLLQVLVSICFCVLSALFIFTVNIYYDHVVYVLRIWISCWWNPRRSCNRNHLEKQKLNFLATCDSSPK